MMKAELRGLDDLRGALDGMGSIFKRETVSRAQRKAMQPCVDRAKQFCPKSDKVKGRRSKRTGRQLDNKHLVNSIGTRTLPGETADIVETSTGPTSPHGHLVEDGHRQVVGRGRNKGKVVGTVPPHPFMQPAWDSTMQECVERFGEEIRPSIEETMQRIRDKVSTNTLTREEYRSIADA